MYRHPLILALLAVFSLPTAASAAALSLEAAPERIGVGDTVRVSVLLDSVVPVNAFAGTLSYDAAMLEPIAISDGNSLISLWITRPAVPEGGAPIAFAGIAPGGFSGDRGMLFSAVFRAKASGAARASLGGIEILRNDGAGGEEPVMARALALSIEQKPLGGYVEQEDVTPPEPFAAYLGDDPELFDGRSYIVFAAVDKSSGIDHYAVAESRLPRFLHPLLPLSWTELPAGPYIYADQRLVSAVYIKAIDRAGNERLSVFPPPRRFTGYEKLASLAILLVIAFFWQKKWRRRSEKDL